MTEITENQTYVILFMIVILLLFLKMILCPLLCSSSFSTGFTEDAGKSLWTAPTKAAPLVVKSESEILHTDTTHHMHDYTNTYTRTSGHTHTHTRLTTAKTPLF